MAKIKIEDYSGQRNPMASVDNRQHEVSIKSGGLVPYKVCLVEVCSFTFIFHSVVQAELCLEYYSRKTRPSTRLTVGGGNGNCADHWELQRWFEQLPLYLLEEPKRLKVMAALERAVMEYRKHPSANTGTAKPDLFGRSFPQD